MPEPSAAVTVTVNACPATAVLGVTSFSWLAGAGFTVRFAVVVRLLAASETVSVCGPVRTSVAENVPWPLVRVESAGSTTPAEVSLLLK